MAYEDDKFPTRSGEALGPANEGEMLSAVGGTDGIRTQQRMTEEGLITTLKTQNEAPPKFWNSREDEEEEVLGPLYMDSGAVDLLSVSPYDPRSALAAPLYYASLQKAAYAAKKLLGKILPPAITNNTPPVDGEAGESFIPVEGADLLGKKDCAAKCPPSMFTGKARLYAQAQLGAPLKKWAWNLDLPMGSPPQWVHDETGFVLNLHVGLYTDANNAHWLLSMSGTGVMVTPLKPSASAKLLVPHLSDPTYAADKTKIEAYILAHSKPGSAADSVFLNFDGLPPPYMLGYGWKFNWDGSAADIIKHVEGSPQHSSTHYRLAINRNTGSGFSTEVSRWTLDLSVVEGPVYWHNSKFGDVICAPEWISNTLYTFGTLYGGWSGDAPVYCFYKEDGGLEVIRYYGSGGEYNVMRSGISEPPAWTWRFDWTADPAAASFLYENGTYGLAGGYGERRLRTNNPTVTGFSSSGQTCVRATHAYTYDAYYISAKTPNGNDAGNLGTNVAYDCYEEEGSIVNTGDTVIHTTNDGVSVYTSGAELVVNQGAYVGRASGSYVPYVFGADVFRSQSEGSYSEAKFSLIVVPFHDSEAAYMYSHLNTTVNEDGNGGAAVGYQHNGGVFQQVVYNFFYIEGTNPAEFWNFPNKYLKVGGAAHQPGIPSDALPPVRTSTDTLIVSSLVTRSGAFDFSSPISLNVFFAGNDYIEQTFYTHSAIHGPVYGFGASNPDGISAAFTDPPPFIGWA